MKKIIGTLALVAIGLVLMLAPTAASAKCDTALPFGQAFPLCGGGTSYCYISSPGTHSTSSLRSTFWILNAGNPGTGLGADNGGFSDDSWLTTYAGGPLFISGDWASASTIDNCPPTGGSSQVVALSDVDAIGNAFFATACVQRISANLVQYNYSLIVPPGDIVLKPLPAAVVTGSIRAGNEATVTVASPNFGPIFYSDNSPGCTLAAVIPQYDLWIKTIGRNAPAPTDHSQDSGSWVLGNTCNVGSSCSATSACGTTNCDGFVAISPRYNSGFQTGDAPGTARNAASSVRFQAGPTLAEPTKFKNIPKGKKLAN